MWVGLSSPSTFQFHKGTIKTLEFLILLYLLLLNFNSIKVRLKHSFREFVIVRKLNFNSIKVRLKPDAAPIAGESKTFQFHKGTIKTKAWLGLCLWAHGYFNSIKVRLKHEVLSALSSIFNLFQFHKGTIKTT